MSDGGQAREPITEGQRKAVLRLNTAERDLALSVGSVHEVLIQGMTMEQFGAAPWNGTQRSKTIFSRRLRECLTAGADLWLCDATIPLPSKASGAEAERLHHVIGRFRQRHGVVDGHARTARPSQACADRGADDGCCWRPGV